MIKCHVICQSPHWPARLKKINVIIKKIMRFKKDLDFSNNIDYKCNIVLSSNALVKKMNYRYCNKNKNTDVLTFVSEIKIENGYQKICDIFLSAEILKKDAKINQVSFYDNFTHILIHSFLHINGFKHKKITDFKKMKDIEVKILNNLKISNPYLYN